jgi:hypothetical protein
MICWCEHVSWFFFANDWTSVNQCVLWTVWC